MRYLFLKLQVNRMARAGAFSGANILVSVIFVSKNIIDIKDVVAILIIIAIILDTFAWLGKDSSGISGRLIFECGVADLVCGR